MRKQRYWVVIPAAGVGRRMGSTIPKQYLTVNGKTVIEHTLTKFLYHRDIEKIVVVINPQEYLWQQFRFYTSDKILVAHGGAERCHSVYSGLQALSQFAHPQDFILVHDAVRPCLHFSDIDNLIATVAEHPIGGILGTKVHDTLKYTNTENQILNTVPRENIWQAHTPQMFRFRLLSQALEQVIQEKLIVSDEAAAIEHLGLVPMIVEGSRHNIKITQSEDLALAEKYL